MSAERTSKPRPRIEAFSDLIFGLALSIGALTLIGEQLTSFEALMIALGLYSFSFLILVGVWLSYSNLTSVLHAETGPLISINIALLFLVSIEPFLFNQLFTEGMFQNVSIIYAIDLAAMFIILAFFNHAITDEKKNHAPKDQLKTYKSARNYSLFIAALFLISTLPFFASAYILPLRVYVWIIAIIVSSGRRISKQVGNRPQVGTD
jgi:uncharacterized membrane protein